MTITMSKYANGFGSKYLAQKIRTTIETELDINPIVTLDFTDVTAMTEEFINKCFKPIAIQRKEKFKKSLKFKNIDDDLFYNIKRIVFPLLL